MTIKERITACRLVERIETQGGLAKALGLSYSIKAGYLRKKCCSKEKAEAISLVDISSALK